MQYLPRWITPRFQEAVEDHPVVILSGARQVGKSTFLRYAPPMNGWRYLTLDDFDVFDQAVRDPRALLTGETPLVLDEVQKAPHLLSAVKGAVDESPPHKRFVLSGSANLLLLKQVSESLAGRAVYLTLGPMTVGEVLEQPQSQFLNRLLFGELPPEATYTPPDVELSFFIWRGLMPPLLTIPRESSIVRWWEGYVSTYLERDLRQLSQVESLVDFRRVMIAASLRNGQILNQTELGRDVRISQPTIHRYLNLLEATHLLERLPAYARNCTKRLMKSPKLFWADTGLTTFLSGYYEPAAVRNSSIWGSLFEGFILHHLRIWSQLQVPQARLFYWRTTLNHEVDFAVEHGARLLAIEVKYVSEARYADVANLRLFLTEYPEAACGVLCYGGNEIRRMDTRILAVPWYVLFGQGGKEA